VHIVGLVIHVILWVFIALLWVRFVFDWVQIFARSWSPSGPLLVLLEAVYSVTDPPINALRRVIPPLRLGSVAIDVSFFLVLVGAFLLLRLNDSLLL
jgi:YggT family protein